MSPRRTLTVREAATLLGRTPDWVRVRLADGSIPGAFRDRTRWYVPEEGLEEWRLQGMPDRGPQPVRHAPEIVTPLGARRVA